MIITTLVIQGSKYTDNICHKVPPCKRIILTHIFVERVRRDFTFKMGDIISCLELMGPSWKRYSVYFREIFLDPPECRLQAFLLHLVDKQQCGKVLSTFLVLIWKSCPDR